LKHSARAFGASRGEEGGRRSGPIDWNESDVWEGHRGTPSQTPSPQQPRTNRKDSCRGLWRDSLTVPCLPSHCPHYLHIALVALTAFALPSRWHHHPLVALPLPAVGLTAPHSPHCRSCSFFWPHVEHLPSLPFTGLSPPPPPFPPPPPHCSLLAFRFSYCNAIAVSFPYPRNALSLPSLLPFLA
jgi:hypothetical protein